MTWRIFRLQELSGEQLNTLDQHILAVPAQGAGGHPSEVCEDCVLDGILHVGPLDKYSKISSRTQVSNHKYFQSVIYLLHYLCLLCFESQHCTEDDVGELMLAGKEKATLVQLRNISAGLWSTKDQEGNWPPMSSGTLASLSKFDFTAFIAGKFWRDYVLTSSKSVPPSPRHATSCLLSILYI